LEEEEVVVVEKHDTEEVDAERLVTTGVRCAGINCCWWYDEIA
jgi:hypothetical protein